MEKTLFAAPTASAENGRLLMVLELSRSSRLAASQVVGDSRLSTHQALAGGAVERLIGLIEHLRRRVPGCARAAVTLAYEAGRDGFWLCRRLRAAGYTCLVLDPSSVLVDQRRRRAKTDRLDLAQLMRALAAWVRVPSPSRRWGRPVRPCWRARCRGAVALRDPGRGAQELGAQGRLRSGRRAHPAPLARGGSEAGV